jgi:hypothetical protein
LSICGVGFPLAYKIGDADNTEVSDDGDVEDEVVVEETTPFPMSNRDDTSEEEDENVPPDAPEPSWYTSIQVFIEYANKISQKLCKYRKFMGRSDQTIRKLKPGKEEFKFYALCCTLSGFVFAFFPSGRLETSKIKDCVERLIFQVPQTQDLKYILAMVIYFSQQQSLQMIREYTIGLVGTFRRQRFWPPKEYTGMYANRFNALYSMRGTA